MNRIIIISLLVLSFNSIAADNSTTELQNQKSQHSNSAEPDNDFFIENIAETSNEANIYGVQAGILSRDAFDTINVYAGLGFISVDLLQENYSFNSLRAFAGVSPNWAVAPYAELGFDLLEEIFSICDSNDDYCSSDPSFSLGVRWKVSQQLMLNVYRKWYRFDGIFLPRSNVGVTGISLGAHF